MCRLNTTDGNKVKIDNMLVLWLRKFILHDGSELDIFSHFWWHVFLNH